MLSPNQEIEIKKEDKTIKNIRVVSSACRTMKLQIRTAAKMITPFPIMSK